MIAHRSLTHKGRVNGMVSGRRIHKSSWGSDWSEEFTGKWGLRELAQFCDVEGPEAARFSPGDSGLVVETLNHLRELATFPLRRAEYLSPWQFDRRQWVVSMLFQRFPPLPLSQTDSSHCQTW